MNVARLVRDSRRSAGLSQAELARRAKTSQPAVARYEAGAATPSLATLERLLRACGRTLLEAERRTLPRQRARPRTAAARLRAARAELRNAAQKHGVRRIRVFGSVARGTASGASDVDLLVELEPTRTLLDLVGFQQDAEAILEMSVDAATPEILKDHIRTRVLREARPL